MLVLCVLNGVLCNSMVLDFRRSHVVSSTLLDRHMNVTWGKLLPAYEREYAYATYHVLVCMHVYDALLLEFAQTFALFRMSSFVHI